MPGRTSSPTIRWSVSAFSGVVQPLQKRAITVALLGEALDERQRRVGDLTPAAVDGERVAAVLDLDDLGHGLVVLLLLVGRVRDRGLEQREAGGGYRIGLVELPGLVLADRVGEAIAELLVGERDRAVAVGRVAQHREGRLQ